jgi:hypothetical protein
LGSRKGLKKNSSPSPDLSRWERHFNEMNRLNPSNLDKGSLLSMAEGLNGSGDGNISGIKIFAT